jgi:hypothetical protein
LPSHPSLPLFLMIGIILRARVGVLEWQRDITFQ